MAKMNRRKPKPGPLLSENPKKPLQRKAYGSIAHVRGSCLGEHDKFLPDGQSDICTIETRDHHDFVAVEEKLDGTCVAIALKDGELLPLQRAGYLCVHSPYKMHHFFHHWVMKNQGTFFDLLSDGERVVGEWLLQAHGTKYDLTDREPFVAFDIMTGKDRLPLSDARKRMKDAGLATPHIVNLGPIYPHQAIEKLGVGGYGALEAPEGLVYRVERNGKHDFIAKYKREDYVDGKYLPGIGLDEGQPPVWNVSPKDITAT